jgi:hypothetical protein
MKIGRGTFKEFFRIILNEDKGIVRNFCCSIMCPIQIIVLTNPNLAPPPPPPQAIHTPTWLTHIIGFWFSHNLRWLNHFVACRLSLVSWEQHGEDFGW